MQFQAKLIQPDGASSFGTCERLPLVFYFAGLGSLGGLGGFDAEGLARSAPVAFVLVAPLRRKGFWWMVSDDSEWGWVDGDFKPQIVKLFVDWMRALAGQSGVDGSNLLALGFSAGAYAITEILAHGEVPLKSVLIGGVHGHSQPDMDGICGKRAKWPDCIRAKWVAYTDRLRRHGGVPGGIIGVHDQGDQMSPWQYAEEIYSLLDHRQRQLQLRPVQLKVLNIPRTRRNKSLHNYHDTALHDPDLVRRLFSQIGEQYPAVPAALPSPVATGSSTCFTASPKRTRHPSPEPNHKVSRLAHGAKKSQLAHLEEDEEEREETEEEGRAELEHRLPRPQCRQEEESWRHRERGTERSAHWQRRGRPAPSQPEPASEEEVPAPWRCQERSTPSRLQRHESPVRQLRDPSVPPPPRQASEAEGSTPWRLPECSAPPRPHPVQGVDQVQSGTDRMLLCASPNCWFQVHSNPEFGGFCCRKCHWCFETGSKSKKKHGGRCERREPPSGAPRSSPLIPERPM